MGNNRFSSVPNISIPRSRFHQPFNHSTSFLHGQLIPIDCFEVLPGDTYNLNLNSIIWMSNPIVPIFGNIKAYVYAFFVPMRLIWKHTEEFYGQNDTTSGYQTTNYQIPYVFVNGSSGNKVDVSTVSHYLGKPLFDSGANTANGSVYQKLACSVLKERGYYLIWNNYFRSQQLQSPFIINNDGNGYLASNPIGTIGGSSVYLNGEVLQVCKEFDYFTACTLSPQYGAAVTLPLGTFAPVITSPLTALSDVDPSTYDYAKKSGNALKWLLNKSNPALILGGDYSNDGEAIPIGIGDYATRSMDYSASDLANEYGLVPANLYADLSNATAATINTLRYAFAVQKYLERSNFGSRFFEMLSVHYGVSSPDATLQIPQRLGGCEIPISISTVLSTADAATSSSSKLGQPGAVSCSAHKKTNLFTKSFIEPGYLYVMICTKHERAYTQGLLREDTKLNRYEFYSPEFANLGDQAVLNKEIYAGATNPDDVFGYQEHWAEYRYRPHRVSGILDPFASGSLDFWNLADEYDYSAQPALDYSWIVENRDFLTRALVTGEDGPDYIADFYFDYTATREMPLFTIPGLIDHFGA